jgi:hypothetical protein
MPLGCYFDQSFAPATCDQQIIAPAGPYVASARAGTDLVCLDVGVCSCTPDASGSCEIPYGGSIAGELIDAKATFDFPTASLVTVTFQ